MKRSLRPLAVALAAASLSILACAQDAAPAEPGAALGERGSPGAAGSGSAAQAAEGPEVAAPQGMARLPEPSGLLLALAGALVVGQVALRRKPSDRV